MHHFFYLLVLSIIGFNCAFAQVKGIRKIVLKKKLQVKGLIKFRQWLESYLE